LVRKPPFLFRGGIAYLK